MDATKRKANPNPRDSASAPSVLFHLWLSPLYRTGWKKALQVEDLYDPLKEDRSELLGNKLQSHWEKELAHQNGKPSRPPSLLRSLVKTFRKDLFILGVLIVVEVTINITQSLFLGKLLSHFRPIPSISREDAMLYAGGMLLCSFISIMGRNYYEITAYHTGLRIRASCCALIYRKSLRLSSGALGDMASGQVVNLLSNDVSRFDIMTLFLHYMWIAPLVTVVIIYLFTRDGGLPSLFGMAVVLLITLAQSYIGKLSSTFRRYIALRTDERVRLVNEVISGIQVIKMYAWEKPFIALMRMARRRELYQLTKTFAVRAVFMTFHLCTTRISLFASVVALSMFGAQISSDKVFVFHSYFNILSWALVGMFVRGCAEVSESYTSVQRIQKFLLYEEYGDELILENKNTNNHKEKQLSNDSEETKKLLNGNKPILCSNSEDDNIKTDYSVILDKVEAKWNTDSSDQTLDKITINVHKGQLLAIIGPVGAGKSSVLQAILRELPVKAGTVRVNGRLSYASQDAWVFASTVRQNILFGSPYEKKRYDKVVKACALSKDFDQFPEGDLTVVGERGVSLSGGQRARINLARAVYREADIYLLDDPLSAVDTHVGQHLFNECMRGYLSDKTVILVTHQLQYLRNADVILLMLHGVSLAVGTYQEIISTGIDYAKLLEEDADTESLTSSSNEVGQQQGLIRRTVSREGKKSSMSSYASSLQSIHSHNSDKDEEQPEASSPLVSALEATSKGTVKGSVYLHYFKSSGSLALFVLVVFLFVMTQIAASCTDYWIAYWTKIEDNRPFSSWNSSTQQQMLSNTSVTFPNASDVSRNIMPDTMLSTDTCVYIYAAIVFSTLLLCITRSIIYYYMMLRISRRLHDSMFCAVIGAAMRFFDTNPSGRILNRFTKDMGSADEILPKIILDSAQVILNLTGAVVLTIITNHFLVFPLVLMLIIFRFIQKYYLKTSKNVKRLEGMVRSPVFSHINASLQGIATIRAFGAENLLKQEFDKHQDLHSAAWFLQIAGGSAFSLAIELTTLTYNISVLISLFVVTQESSGGEVGLAITQSMMLTGMLQWGIRQSTEVFNNMMSAERLLEYVQLPPEQGELKAESKPSSEWPQKGRIKLDHVYLRYSTEDSPVLHDLNLDIQPGEKIGIVGRTGAGKSSLIATLFRMAIVEGRVVIDDFDTNDVTLTRLRSSISIIPQDPVLFSGTMRYNLDPFQEYPDEKLWKALEEVELKDALSEEQGLNTRVQEGGSNFSVGQRQLVCLARAILRANRILMMDEATANVDPQTDKLIQETIRVKFRACTVLTVAHRLNTVIDSDRVLVMDNGRVAEFDHPWRLLERPGSVFKSMVNQLEGHGAEQLRQAAKQHYEQLFPLTKS